MPEQMTAEKLAEIRSVDLLELMSERAAGQISGYLAALLARIAELEAERHTTNEALSDAAEALREKEQRLTELETAAGLVAEYRVPTAEKWLSIRRKPNGDKWAVAQTFGHSPMRVWTGELWISLALATDSELWNYDSADAALEAATKLTEAGDLL